VNPTGNFIRARHALLGFVTLAALGWAPRAGAREPIVTRFDVPDNRIAITFDACATKTHGYGFDRHVYRVLQREQVPATIFVSGRWAEFHPAVMTELSADPLIEFGNHSYDHPHMSRLTNDDMEREVDETEAVLGRYGKVVILADADSDGNHIATLLLTFIYRHLPQLIADGRVFLAQPPLYRIDIGKDTHWALDDAHKDAILKQHAKNGRGTPEITRFKGLGEMMPKVLWETTLNPRTRRLLRVEVTDQIVTDRVINELMGKDASARFRFIMERADEAEELDV